MGVDSIGSFGEDRPYNHPPFCPSVRTPPMKSPVRSFTVEIKRRGKRVMGESKPSIWSDVALQGEETPNDGGRESEQGLPQEHDDQKPAPSGRILPDLSSNADEQDILKRGTKT